MRTTSGGQATEDGTFTQQKRRDQLVDCMIEVIAEAGFARASVGELARRTGVSKGVVTYHFAAKDDLIRAVITDVVASMAEYLEPRLALPSRRGSQNGSSLPTSPRGPGITAATPGRCWPWSGSSTASVMR